jgi:hypothetical protein
MGAKNPLIYDKENYKNKSIMPFIKNKIGGFRNVEVYKLYSYKCRFI